MIEDALDLKGGACAMKNAALSPWLRLLNAFDCLLQRCPAWVLVTLLPVLAFIHSGFDQQFPNNGIEASTLTYPEPLAASEASSYGVRTIAWALGITTDASFLRLTILLVFGSLWIIGIFSLRMFGRRVALVVLVIIAVGPIGTSLTNNLGRADVLVIAGGLVLGLFGRGVAIGVIGAVLMACGNPEQGLVASLCFLLVALALRSATLTKTAWVALSTSLACAGIAIAILHHLGRESRLDYLVRNLRQSLSYFLQALPLELYAGFGLSVVFILITLTALTWARALTLVLGVILIPLAFTAITLDQTRVLVAVSAASVAAVLRWSVPRCLLALDDYGLHASSTVLVICAVLLPPVAVAYPGTVRLPYRTPVELFFNPAAGG